MLYAIIMILAIDIILMYFRLKDETNINASLKKTINNLEDDLDSANSRVENRDNLIKELNEEHKILINNASEYRNEIAKLKELVHDDQSQN